MSIRAKFVAVFGEDVAQKIEQAAEGHKNGIHDRKGSDPFKWALCICIGYKCLTVNREDHGLEGLDSDKVKEWCREEGELGSHDGDVDFLAMFCGMYEEWIGEEVK